MGRLDGKGCSGDGRGIRDRRATVKRFVPRRERCILRSDGERASAWRPNSRPPAQVVFTQAGRWDRAACLAFVNGARRSSGGSTSSSTMPASANTRSRRGERGELERDPQRQPDELRLLRQGGGAADAPQRGRRHRQRRFCAFRRRRRRQPAVRHPPRPRSRLDAALAADHSPEGIRANAVGPGPIFTPFHQRRIAASGETVSQYNAGRARHDAEAPGQGRGGRAAILFLASTMPLCHRRAAVRGRRLTAL